MIWIPALLLKTAGPSYYFENNPLKPNNVDTFVGFHEIYGTLSSGLLKESSSSLESFSQGRREPIISLLTLGSSHPV